MKDDYIAVCQLDNEIEAQMIDDILEENAIPHMLRYADSAPLPVFDITDGYATLFAEEEYADEIRALVEEMRSASFDASELYAGDDERPDDEEDPYGAAFDEDE